MAMEPLAAHRYVWSKAYMRPGRCGLDEEHRASKEDTETGTGHLEYLSPKLQSQVKRRRSRKPFRLFDLPAEIQHLIFHHHFAASSPNSTSSGQWSVTLEYERLTMFRSRFLISGVPPIDLLLTCRRIYADARRIRLGLFSGRLILNSVFILVPLRRQEKFQWLRDNVRILTFSDSSVHPERWNRYYDCFEQLQRLEIEFPTVTCLKPPRFTGPSANVVGGGGGGGVFQSPNPSQGQSQNGDEEAGEIGFWDLKKVLSGERDEALITSLDTFRLALVDQLSGTVEAAITQRYCLTEEAGGSARTSEPWGGAVDVQIRLCDAGAVVIGRQFVSRDSPTFHKGRAQMDSGSSR